MYPITNAVKALYDAEQKQVLRITGTDKNGRAVSVTDEDIVLGGFSIDHYCCNGDKLEVGTAIAGQMTLKLNNTDGRFNNIVFEGTELYVEMGIADWSQSSPTVNWMPCGRFTPDMQPRRLNQIELTCLDRMTKFDVAVDGTALTFPATVAGLVGQVDTLCGVTLAASISNLPNAGVSIAGLPTGEGEMTYRDLIRWCAGIMATNAWFDWNGQLRFTWYNNSTGYEITVANRFDSDLYENDLTVTGAVYTNASGVEIVEGTDDYAIDLTGNALAGPIIATVLPVIANAVSGFVYRPFTATVVNAPYLWPMDVVTFEDRDGNDHTSVLTNVAFGINGNTALESRGMTYALNQRAQPKGVTKEQAQLISEAMERVETDIDDSLTQQEIFNRLTDNGAAQGLVLYNGQLYMNASYMRTGTLDADLVNVINLNASNINTGTLSADLIEIMSYDPEIQVASEFAPETLFAFETIADGWIVNGSQYEAGLFRLTNAEKFRGKSGTLTARLDSVPGGCEDWYDAYEGGEIVDVVETYEAFGPDKTYSSPEDAEEHGTPDPSGDIIGVVKDGDEYIYTHDFTVPNDAVSFFQFSLKFSRVRSVVVKFDDRPGFRYSDYLTINKTGLKVGNLVVDAEGNIDAGGDLKMAGETQLGGDLSVAGDAAVDGDTTVSGDLAVDGALSVGNAAQTRANLGVTPANIGALALSGGTVTGAIFRQVNADFTTPPSTEEWNGITPYTDSGNDVKGGVYNQREPDGSYRTLLGARGSNGWGYIAATIDSSGNQGYYLSHPQAMLSALNILWTKVTGTTGSTGVVGLGLARNRYMVFAVWSSVSSGASQIATPMVTANGTNWSALVETISHTAVANTSVTLYVGYIDFGAGNIS